MPARHVLAIDEGTTGITLLLYDREGRVERQVYSEFRQIYPRPGWVEHDPEEIWSTAARLMRQVLDGLKPSDVAGIGITNQRETTVVWDRKSGKPIANAIVWQCRRTADRCQALRAAGKEPLFREKTGLVLDAYFSGTKVAWLLENVAGARARAEAGDLCFGTIDSWLIWKLTGGKVHATDHTNASRTLLYDIHERRFDDRLLSELGVPARLLPEVKPSACIYGTTAPGAFLGAEVPVAAAVGDQQSALFGQGCVEPGSLKNTYGTGCFALLNAGKARVASRSGLLTTLACDAKGEPVYALEGSVFIAGAVVQWLRDGLGLIATAAESEAKARAVSDSGGVFLVPAFVGLGAPYWDMEARGAILGITRGTTRDHLVRAALESIAYQTRDLIDALRNDLPSGSPPLRDLRVDGGATANDFLMQFQADILGMRVVRPENIATTAQGAALLAGLATGFFSSFDETRAFRRTGRTFEPALDAAERDRLYRGWKDAVARVLTRRA